MVKKNIIASSSFLILALFNLLFPPYIFIGEGGIIVKRYMFESIFGEVANKGYEFPLTKSSIFYPCTIDLRTLFILLLISLVIALIMQGLYNLIKKKISLEAK